MKILLKKTALFLCDGFFILSAICHKLSNTMRKNKKEAEKKKILILIGKISKGGAERAAVNLAEKLAKDNEVSIAIYDKENYGQEVKNYSCFVHVIEVEGNGPISRIFGIKRLKKKNQITHCISFGTYANFLNTITRVKEKCIISVRNFSSIAEKGIILKLKHKIANALSDKIVAVSKSVEMDEIKNYHVNSNKICTISNYCNKDHILNAINQYAIDEIDKPIFMNSHVIITVGKLKEQKGQWHLIRAFSKVVQKHDDAKLIILGVGEMKEYFKNLIANLHLENYVYLLSHKNNNVYTYMAASNIFVFPTLFEGMPNVILEAMQCGLPIIATDCYGGNKEILAPSIPFNEEVTEIKECEYGILIPRLDFKQYKAEDRLTKEEELLADAIIYMLEEKNLREHYQQKSIERVQTYNQVNYVEEWKKTL